MIPRRSLPLVAFALAVAVLVAHAPIVLGGMTWNDVRYHTEVAPPRLAAAEAIQGGSLPAWWDATGLGVPLLAEPAHGAVYPPLWLAASPRWLDLALLLHLAWAGLGVAVWARRRRPSGSGGVTDHAALVAGILIATAGLFASTALRGALPALAHVPWIGAASAWLATATTRRDQLRASAAIGGLLALTALAGELAVLCDAIVLAAVLGARRRTLPWLAAAIGAGLAIGAVQWIPAALQLGRGTGATIDALPLARLIELIVPSNFGGGDPGRALTALAGARPWAPSLFVGAPLLALAAVRTPARRVLAVLSLYTTLALVIGRGGGWPAVLGAPELHLAALVLVLGAHAGHGIDALTRGDRRAVRCFGVAAVCAAGALGALAALRARHPEASLAIDRALLDGGLGVVCMVVVLLLVWRARGRALSLVLALLVLPGVGAARALAPVIARALVDEPPPWALATESLPRPLRLYRPAFLHDRLEPLAAPVELAGAMATFAGTSGWRWRIATARSEHPARVPEHDRVWLAASGEGGALLDRFGIGLAILPSTLVGPRDLTELGRRGDWALVSLPVAPVAAVLRGWKWAIAEDDAVDLLFAAGGGTNILRGTTVLRGAGEPRADLGPPLACGIEAWRPGDIELQCSPDRDGYAVISSSTDPGWSVSVDGVDTPWLTADVLRRAVKIDRGTHRLHWRYRPSGLVLGLVLAALGLIALILLLVLARRASPPTPPTDN